MVVALLAVTAISGWSMGGWAVVTVDALPEYVEAGKPFTLTWAIRGHGQKLVAWPRTGVTAERTGHEIASPAVAGPEGRRLFSYHPFSGSERGHEKAFPVFAGSETGFYSATVTLPGPGDWTLTIWANTGHRMLPLKVVDAGAEPRPQRLTERGAHLFVAAGCITCHAHGDIDQPVMVPVGPDLSSLAHSEDYLAAVLRDPDSILDYDVPALGWFPRMPDLGLDEPEIEALVAFLTAEPPVRESVVQLPGRIPIP